MVTKSDLKNQGAVFVLISTFFKETYTPRISSQEGYRSVNTVWAYCICTVCNPALAINAEFRSDGWNLYTAFHVK